jgi:hypothetical protein
MRTGLVRKYGERDTAQEYIDVVAVQCHNLPKSVRDTALRMYNHIAKNTTFNGRSPSMLAMTLVNLAAIENHRHIPSREWSGRNSCSYNTLLIHSRELKDEFDKTNDFPNLKRHRFGK